MKITVFALLAIICLSCSRSPGVKHDTAECGSRQANREYFDPGSLPDQNLTELKPCDIIVKPNLNYIPGTTRVDGGSLFGHASIVIKGGTSTSESALLPGVITFESDARDVPDEFQLRSVAAYVPGNDFRYSNDSYMPGKFGNLYRLRMYLTDTQRDSIIKFILGQDNGISHYRASKRYKPGSDTLWKPHAKGEDPEYWYCSLIIWQAFYNVLGIDLDANKGYYVYPNDLVNSPYFDDEPGKHEKRVRF